MAFDNIIQILSFRFCFIINCYFISWNEIALKAHRENLKGKHICQLKCKALLNRADDPTLNHYGRVQYPDQFSEKRSDQVTTHKALNWDRGYKYPIICWSGHLRPWTTGLRNLAKGGGLLGALLGTEAPWLSHPVGAGKCSVHLSWLPTSEWGRTTSLCPDPTISPWARSPSTLTASLLFLRDICCQLWQSYVPVRRTIYPEDGFVEAVKNWKRRTRSTC